MKITPDFQQILTVFFDLKELEETSRCLPTSRNCKKKQFSNFAPGRKGMKKKRGARNCFFTKKSMDLWPSNYFRIFSSFPIPLIISYNMKINIIHFDHTAITTNSLLLFLIYCLLYEYSNCISIFFTCEYHRYGIRGFKPNF